MIIPTLAVAFAAFCIWLGVRIVNRRERWAKWTLAAVVGVPVLYVASFGPACWITSRLGSSTGADIVSRVYDPAIRACSGCSKVVANLAWWYSEVGAPDDWKWQFSHWHQLDGSESCIGPHD